MIMICVNPRSSAVHIFNPRITEVVEASPDVFACDMRVFLKQLEIEVRSVGPARGVE